MEQRSTLLTIAVAALVVPAGCATIGGNSSDAAGGDGASLSEASDADRTAADGGDG